MNAKNTPIHLYIKLWKWTNGERNSNERHAWKFCMDQVTIQGIDIFTFLH